MALHYIIDYIDMPGNDISKDSDCGGNVGYELLKELKLDIRKNCEYMQAKLRKVSVLYVIKEHCKCFNAFGNNSDDYANKIIIKIELDRHHIRKGVVSSIDVLQGISLYRNHNTLISKDSVIDYINNHIDINISKTAISNKMMSDFSRLIDELCN